MKRFIFAVAMLLSLALAPAGLEAQTPAKLYTKRVRMADFPNVQTKVVLPGHSMLELTVKQEILMRWDASPYEFCTPDDYEAMKMDNSFYFLRLAQADGLVFMILSKGGKEDETDQLRIPFEVVRVPIGAYGEASGLEAYLMGAFVDIVQQYALKSMTSDRVGYLGLESCNGKNMEGKTVVTEQDRVLEALSSETPDVLAGISIAPLNTSSKTFCYKMLVDAHTHELYYYSREKYKDSSAAQFSGKELARFEKRNAVVE